MKRFSLRRMIFPVLVLGSALPAFAGVTYTCDPNIEAAHAGTCAFLNSTIAGLYNSTFSNANADIYIQYGAVSLGHSNYSLAQASYSVYLGALTASAQASGNTVQLAAVKALNTFDTPVYGNAQILMPVTLATALGFTTGNFGLMADGVTFCANPGTSTCFDGIITITNQTGNLYYRAGNEAAGQLDFYSVVEHETDEVLGTASCIVTFGPTLADQCPGNTTPSAVDLFRYQSAGTPVLISNTPGAYFSYDGGQTNGANGNVYNTLDNGMDYADFLASCPGRQSVQDAASCTGHDQGVDITNDGGAEINILNAIGYKLNPRAVTPPVISSVVNGATNRSTMAANTYLQINGTGLSTTTAGRTWAGPDFPMNSNGTLGLPTALDGTSVTVNGTPAYVEYISPTQINIISPAVAATGNGIQVIVDLNGQLSNAFPITLENLAPSFFTYLPGPATNYKYLVAYHAANPAVDVGPVGLYPSAPNLTTPAKPGETIVLFGTGFGATSPPIAPGIVTDRTYPLSPFPPATLGGIPATVGFAGLVTPFAQVYQFNLTIPANASNGDLALIVNVNGTQSFSGLVTVQAP
jgi:uncharacterized protein (TIGR03437 family)